MESAELIAELRVQFEAWKDEILRLAAISKGQSGSKNFTEKLGGLTYDQILSTFDAELKAHTDLPNPHNLTLGVLGGMAQSTYNVLEQSYYPRSGFPFTKVPKVVVSTTGTLIEVYSFEMMFMGTMINVLGGRFTISSTTRKYLKVTVTGTPGNWVGTLTLSDTVNEDIRTIIVGHSALVGAAPVTVTTAIFRLGQAAVTQTPRGLAIPASKGTPTLPQSLEPGWFAT